VLRLQMCPFHIMLRKCCPLSTRRPASAPACVSILPLLRQMVYTVPRRSAVCSIVQFSSEMCGIGIGHEKKRKHLLSRPRIRICQRPKMLGYRFLLDLISLRMFGF
jgi:hypothetical protein